MKIVEERKNMKRYIKKVALIPLKMLTSSLSLTKDQSHG